MKLQKYRVYFKGKNEDTGKLYLMEHTEEVFCYSTVTAIRLGMKRVPLEILRRPVVAVEAHRDMT